MRTLISDHEIHKRLIIAIEKSFSNPKKGSKPWQKVPCSKSAFYKYRQSFKREKKTYFRETNKKLRGRDEVKYKEVTEYTPYLDVKKDRKREFQKNHPQTIVNIEELIIHIKQCILNKPENGISLIMNLLRDKCAKANIQCRISRRTVHKILTQLGLNTKELRIAYMQKQ